MTSHRWPAPLPLRALAWVALVTALLSPFATPRAAYADETGAATTTLAPAPSADGLGTALKAAWQGFFLQFNVGYGTDGGDAGPAVPTPNQGNVTINGSSFEQWRTKGCLFGTSGCYNEAIRTNSGSGLAVAFQIGYNILGYASLWADFAWKGSFGSKAEMAGTGTASLMVGFHPLRFWRADTPVDVRLYGGYGFFDILYYYETVFQVEATGKAFTGTAIPFGLSSQYRIPDSVFAIGVDLRLVRASYDKWIYNNDKDIASDLSSAPVTTLRFEPRVVFGWHF